MQKLKPYLLSLSICLLLLASLQGCKKDPLFIDDNNPPTGTFVPTVLIENYVNRIYIDLLGREPLDAEMDREVQLLKDNDLAESTRRQIIERLQTDNSFVEGDSSYQKAYYQRIYDIVKVQMIEGVEDDYIIQEGINQFSTDLTGFEASGDSFNAAIKRADIQECYDLLSIPSDYRFGRIGINDVFRRSIDNFVYDVINMNTFNFINATFDNMFFRFPTQQEFDISFEMIESNVSGSILGQSGSNRGDYMDIVTNSRQFYEGIVVWQYKSLVLRDPTAQEIDDIMATFYNDGNFQEVQVKIMITDEYANF